MPTKTRPKRGLRRIPLERRQPRDEHLPDFRDRDRPDRGHGPQLGEQLEHARRMPERARRQALETIQPLAPRRRLRQRRERVDERQGEAAQLVERREIAGDGGSLRRSRIVRHGFVAADGQLVGEPVEPPAPAIGAADDRRLDEQPLPFPRGVAVPRSWSSSSVQGRRRGCDLGVTRPRGLVNQVEQRQLSAGRASRLEERPAATGSATGAPRCVAPRDLSERRGTRRIGGPTGPRPRRPRAPGTHGPWDPDVACRAHTRRARRPGRARARAVPSSCRACGARRPCHRTPRRDRRLRQDASRDFDGFATFSGRREAHQVVRAVTRPADIREQIRADATQRGGRWALGRRVPSIAVAGREERQRALVAGGDREQRLRRERDQRRDESRFGRRRDRARRASSTGRPASVPGARAGTRRAASSKQGRAIDDARVGELGRRTRSASRARSGPGGGSRASAVDRTSRLREPRRASPRPREETRGCRRPARDRRARRRDGARRWHGPTPPRRRRPNRPSTPRAARRAPAARDASWPSVKRCRPKLAPRATASVRQKSSAASRVAPTTTTSAAGPRADTNASAAARRSEAEADTKARRGMVKTGAGCTGAGCKACWCRCHRRPLAPQHQACTCTLRASATLPH